MKNLRKWTSADVQAALERVKPEEGSDYKGYCEKQYDAMASYAYDHYISMKGVPDAYNCPRAFLEWEPEDK